MAAAIIGLLVVGFVLGLIVTNIHDAIRRPTIRRLAMRNVTRRRGEAALVMLGSLLGTAIITGALVVGNTVGASFRDEARTGLGPVDEVVRTLGLDNAAVMRALSSPAVPGTDGLLSMTRAGVSVATTGSDVRAEPFAGINEVDFDQARVFGRNPAATGMARAGATPSGNEAVITKSLAKKLEVTKPGETIVVYGFATKTEMTVRQIIPNIGVAGFGGRSLFAPPGTIARLIAANAAGGANGAGTEPPNSLALVSNNGGVFDGAKKTDAVTKVLKQRLAGQAGFDVREVKQDTLDRAKSFSDQFTQLFTFIGFFSVIAGILLLINIFVMLADERKSELGMLRAVGLKRNQLIRAFGMEGAVYAVVSAAVGVVVGIGLGRVVATVAQGVFNSGGGGRGGLSLRFAVAPASLFIGFFAGALIALITVWGTSFSTGRLNVIRAIRDIPKPPASSTVRRRTYVLSTLGIVAGLVNLRGGAANNGWFGVLAGVPIASWSAIPLLRAVIKRRFAIIFGCGIAIVWAIACFSLFPDALASTEFGAFIVQGVILVGSAVAIVATNADLATWVVSKLGVSRRTLAARLGFAYPLARVFRTSMLLGMYAIVIFTITFISVFGDLFAAQAPQYARDTAAGYDILVDSNYSNPVPSAALLADPDVTADATLDQAYPSWTTPSETKLSPWEMTGFDESLLARGVPKLNDRLTRFKDDRSVWKAVMTDPSLVVISNYFLQNGGPPEAGLEIGDHIKAYDLVSGRVATLTIAGKLDSDFTFNGPMVGKAFMNAFASDATPSRHYVAVRPGANPELVADRLTGRLIDYGVQADTFQNKIEDALKTQQGFMALMRGYLGLGLIIGIAGLGVVMIRAVRERRRQIGMLRAMGFPNRVVRQTFLTESAFIAITGIAIGTILALITSYSMLTNGDTFGGQNIHFKIPTASILIVSTVALVASLIAASFPAGQASRIKPAVALRIAD